MASILGELVVKLAADTGALEKGLKSAKDKVGGFSKAMGDMGKIAGGIVMGQGIMKAPGFFMDAAQAAADDAASMAKLQQAVENSGAVWETYKDQLNGVIEAAQKRGFTDDAARNALSLLTAQTGSAEEAAKRFTIAQDVARGANIDLETASRLLGKVTEENADVFKKMGISIGAGATEAEAFAALQAKFGGQADAYANSTAGQMEAAKIQMGELKEKIGYAVLPILTSLTKLVAQDLVPAISAFVDVAGPKIKAVVVPAFEALKDVFGFLVKHKAETVAALIGIGAAITTVMIPATIAWIAAEWAKVTALTAAAVAFIAANAPLIAIGAAIAVVVAAVVLLIQHWDDVTAATGRFLDMVKGVPVLGEIVTVLEGVVKSTIGNIVDYFQSIIQVGKDIITFFKCIFTGDFSGAWEAIKKLTGDILASIVDYIKLGFIDEILGMLKGFVPWDAIKDKMGDLKDNAIAAFLAPITWLKENWTDIILKALLATPFAPIVLLAIDGFGVRTALQDAMTATKNFVSDRVNDIVGFFTGLPGKLTTALSGIGGAISGGFKAGANLVIGYINALALGWETVINTLANLINAIPDFSVPDWVPVIGGNSFGIPDMPTISLPRVPTLAAGGIVTRPTLALLGERGAEAVVPLTGAGSVGTTIINNYHIEPHIQGSILSERDLVSVIADAMRRGRFRGLGSPA